MRRHRVPAVAMIFDSALGIFILAPLPGWPQLAGFISSAAVLSLAYLAARSALGRTGEPLYLANAWWLIAYFAAMGIISWLGNFGGGLGVIPAGLDMLAIAVVSLAVFWLAIRTELPRGVTRRLIAAAEAHPSNAPEAARAVGARAQPPCNTARNFIAVRVRSLFADPPTGHKLPP